MIRPDYETAIETQLSQWPEASERYAALGKTDRRLFRIGDLDVAVQHNPGRIRSTAAAVDASTISERPCFLCESNRPSEQLSAEFPEGWDFLINPFPIFPVHFTVASRRHEPQTTAPLDMVTVAEAIPGLACFFNGARAGASAPDHLHFQGVLKSELPLLCLAERVHKTDRSEIRTSSDLCIDTPFLFVSAVVRPDPDGMAVLRQIPEICGTDPKTGKPDTGLVNTFFWIGDDATLRAVAVPRSAHRPDCFYDEGDARMTVSPGAIDMAGVIILPERKDFERITADDIRRIYSQVGVRTYTSPKTALRANKN